MAANTVCYFPDGRISDTYQPCTSTEGGAHSWCCELSSSACSSNGYCSGSNGLMYRGGCTDKSWVDPSCPQYCQNIQPDTFSTLFNCASPGTYSQTWCCFTGSSDSCCGTSFSVDFGNIFSPNATTTVTVVSTVSVTPTASNPSTAVTTTPTSSPSSSSNSTTIGVGIGVGLGVLLLAIAGILLIFIHERKRRRATEQRLEAKLAALQGNGNQAPSTEKAVADKHDYVPGEGQGNRYHESGAREIYEGENRNAPPAFEVGSTSEPRYELDR